MSWQIPQFPVEMSWTEGESKPSGIDFEKRNPSGPPMSVTVTIESPSKAILRTTNIKKIHINFEDLMRFCKIPEDLILQVIRYVRDYIDHIDIVISDSGSIEFEAEIPSEWTLVDVLLNGSHIDYEMTDNTLKVTVSLSESTLTLKLNPTTAQQTYNVINISTALMTIIIISFMSISLIKALREKK